MGEKRTEVEIVPTGAPTGAVVKGVDLSRDVPGDDIFRILQAFHEHMLLIFPGQQLTQERLLEVAQWFGPLNVPPKNIPVLGDENQPPVVPISNFAEGGMLGNRDLFPHSDMSYLPIPLLGAVLYAQEVPPEGGDTAFANLYQAHDDLDEETRRLVADLRVWSYNPYTPKFADRGAGLGGAGQKFVEEDLPVFPHPIVRTHPVTGRKSLYIGDLCEEIVGLEDKEQAAALLRRLREHVDEDRYYYTHKWSVGDMLVWDNRCTNHKRTTWDDAERRLMHRVQIAGTVPF